MRKRPLCLIAVFFLVIQAVLWGWFWKGKETEPAPLERFAKEKDRVTLTGIVFRREEKPAYQLYYLADTQIRIKNQFIKESKLLVYVEREHTSLEKEKRKNQTKESEIAVGNKVRFSGSLSFFKEERNPGNFDEKFYYQRQGIHARVWAEKTEILDRSENFWKERLVRLRLGWKNILKDGMGEYYGNIMSAILLGEKSELDQETADLYRKGGIGHILAISGLHMSFLGIGFYTLLRKMGTGFAAAGFLGVLFLLGYTVMTGEGVSGLRALIMFIVRVGADVFGRTYDMATSLLLAAALLVAVQPMYLSDAGFFLSFGALFGIVFITPILEQFQVVPKIFCAAISIHLVLLPVLLFYYFEIPPYSFLLNLFVVPLMSVVLGSGVAGSVLSLFWPGGGTAVFHICKWILWLYEKGCTLAMGLPGSRLILGKPPVLGMVFYYVLLTAGCFLGYRNKIRKKVVLEKKEDKKEKEKKRRWRLILRLWAVCLTSGFCLICFLENRGSGELKVTLLDVGQGDCLHIRTPSGKNWLIDGGSSDVGEVGKYRIMPYLESQGVGTLDYIFVSHGDADHINGIRELLENQEFGISVETLVLPSRRVLDEALTDLAAQAGKRGTRVVTMEAGEQLSEGEVCVSCLAPGKDYRGQTGNEASMVLSLHYRQFDMLFTGDIEGEGEKALIQSGALRDIDVLKAAHHGSKYSTPEELLAQIKPEITLISAGMENRYGHPHKETLKRLEEKGSRIYMTPESMAVSLYTDGAEVRVEEYKNHRK